MNTVNRRIRLFFALIFSGISLLLSLLYTLRYFNFDIAIGPNKGTTLIALGLSAVAFVTAVKLRSPLVGVILTISGLIIIAPPVSAIMADGMITIPGPILGVIFFSPILALGVAKLITTRNRASKSKEVGVAVSQTRENSTV